MQRMNRDAARIVLEDWLASRMPDASGLAVLALTTPKGGGNSAETCFLDIAYERKGERKMETLVLRRQLEGDDLLLDSGLELPWKVMEALEAHPQVPVPSLIGIERDRSVLGSPFFIMRRVAGRIAPQFPNYNLEGWVAELPAERRSLAWRNAIEAMARIHAVNWRSGFAFLDRPERGPTGLEQYLNGVAEWYRWASQARAQPVADAALDYLTRNKPAGSSTSLIWGDAIPANMLFADDLSIAAVIDWEAASLGPGEIDLGWWLVFDELFSAGFGAKRLPGLPDRQETIALYEQAAGRTVLDMTYFEVLSLLRLAIVTTRQFDRQVKFGTVPASSKAYLANPTTAQIARKLGLPVPEVGREFQDFLAAATKHQV